MQAFTPNYFVRARMANVATQQSLPAARWRMLSRMQSLDEDARLMLRYRDGDADAFLALYARHKGPLYRYLLRQVRNAGAAADVFQEVWSRLVATRARYEARAKFATYLFHIAHNCTVDFFRRD